MRYTFLFILTLVLVSGFVAYFGDLLGRKMGKKRLTLFGLRPRYTAIIVTTITGMLIAGLTMATMMGFSKTLRHVLVAGEQMLKENPRLSAQNQELRATNVTLREDGSKLRKQQAALEAQLADSIELQKKAETDLRNAQAARDEALTARDEARRRVDDLSRQIDANRRELAELTERRKLNEKQLAELGEHLARSEEELAARREDLRAKQNELNARQAELFAAVDKVTSIRQEVDDLNNLLAEQAAKVREQTELIEEQERKLTAQHWEGTRIAQWYTSMREGDIKFRQGEELARKAIRPGQYRTVYRELTSLLDEVSRIAKARGAGSSDNGRAIRLVTVDPGSGFIENDEQTCLRHWSESIARSPEEVMVQVIASGNILEGEQAVVEFRSYYNKVAFIKGETVARTKKPIDGTMTEGRILGQVVRFLQDEVRQAASKAGIIPVANDDPQIRDDQLDELLSLVARIRALDGPVSIRALAETDIKRAGPLDLCSMNFSIALATAQEKQGG